MYHQLVLLTLVILITQCGNKLSTQDQKIETIKQPQKVFIGTYTQDEGWVNGKGDGIYAGELAKDGLAINDVQLAAELINPSF